MGVPLALYPHRSHLLPRDRTATARAPHEDAAIRMRPAAGFTHFDMPGPPYLSRITRHCDGASWIELDRQPEPPSHTSRTR